MNRHWIACVAFSLAAACREAPPAPPPEVAAASEPAQQRAPAAAPDAGRVAEIEQVREQTSDNEQHVTLVFSASVAGQLVPCGCSPDQRGGMPRAVALVEKLRKENPALLYIDAGDLLFESTSAPPRQLLTQRTMKARVLAQGDVLLHAAARAVGQRDLALGPQFLQETAQGVPLLDAGFAAPGLRATLLADAGGVKVGIFAAGFEADPAQVIAARAKGLREQGARVVVLLLHPRGGGAVPSAQALLPAAQTAGVDMVVLGRRDDPAADPDLRDPGPPALFAIEGHGQSLLRVDVHLGAAGTLQFAPSASDRADELKAIDQRIDRFKSQIELYPQRKAQLEAKIAELRQRKKAIAGTPIPKPAPGTSWADAAFLPVDGKAGTDKDAQALVDAYDEQIARINLEEAKTQPASCPAPARGEPYYVGVNNCAECHKDATEFWKETRHAHAYETLVAVKKQYSLDCINCHVTGWRQPGGVCRIDRTEFGSPGFDGRGVGRRDVQCEDCHGPGSKHAADPPEHIRTEVPASFCVHCHEAANSPRFDDAKYRPFIVGPGHGQPLAKGKKPRPPEGYPQ